MSNKLEPIAKLNAREPKISGGGMPDRNKETYSKMPGMGLAPDFLAAARWVA